MPDKCIKQEAYLKSKKISSVSCLAQCLFFRLILMVDDSGHYVGPTKKIHPHTDELEIDLALQELVIAGLIRISGDRSLEIISCKQWVEL